MRTRLIWAIAAFVAGFGVVPHGQQPAGGLDGGTIRTAIEQAGIPLAAVEVEPLAPGWTRVTIDLGPSALTGLEALTAQIIERTARLTSGGGHVEYRFLVGGVRLDQRLSSVATGRVGGQAVGVARRVVVSAGHGWYHHEPSGSWRLQRSYFWGIVEDLVNWDITHYLRNELIASNFDARPARNPDRLAGTGVSGRPRFEESAKYYIRDLGAPSSAWNSGADDYSKDINSRPFYANWLDAALLVSIHNNGGEGSGTESWYDTSNAFEADSRRLAEIVNRRVVAAIRQRYDPNWPDRGLRSCNGCHGENRLAARPAVIVEIAFMDTKSPDNDALHSEAFKQIVAQAIRDAIEEFTGPAPAGDVDGQARQDLSARAARDARFGTAADGSFGIDADWDPTYQLRWLDFDLAGGGRVRLYHARHRTEGTRFVGFWDPDTKQWSGWERA